MVSTKKVGEKYFQVYFNAVIYGLINVVELLLLFIKSGP